MIAMHRLSLLFVLGNALTPVSLAQAPPKDEMTTYQMVLFLRGPKYDAIADAEVTRLTQAHEANLEQLLQDGVALIGGTVEGDGPMREVAVLSVKSADEAKQRFADDPIVKSERLAIEIHPWFAARNILLKPDDPAETVPCVLGILRQGKNVAADAPSANDLMKDHLGNITRMAELGDLVIAGPFGDHGERRGVLLFRITDEKRIRELVSEDPMVKTGHLTLELFRWNVPKGTLPPRAEKKTPEQG